LGESVETNWDQFWEKHRGGRFTEVSWSKRRILSALQSYVHRGDRVLDAGCGSGFFSAYFVAQGCETYSLDYSQESLSIARDKTGGRSRAYLCRDLLDPALATEYAGRFDLVFSDGLFEHFAAAEQDVILHHMKALTVPEGSIVTFVPNVWSPWSLVRPFLMPGIAEEPFTRQRLLDLYGRNECRVRESGGINVLPFRYSPEALLGSRFGMLLYAIGR
jgi:SAM-dependent methyltransferase